MGVRLVCVGGSFVHWVVGCALKQNSKHAEIYDRCGGLRTSTRDLLCCALHEWCAWVPSIGRWHRAWRCREYSGVAGELTLNPETLLKLTSSAFRIFLTVSSGTALHSLHFKFTPSRYTLPGTCAVLGKREVERRHNKMLSPATFHVYSFELARQYFFFLFRFFFVCGWWKWNIIPFSYSLYMAIVLNGCRSDRYHCFSFVLLPTLSFIRLDCHKLKTIFRQCCWDKELNDEIYSLELELDLLCTLLKRIYSLRTAVLFSPEDG